MFELSSLLILGVLAQWLADRLKTPAILPLILIGLAAGPLSTLITADGSKLLDPMWNGEHGLFPGDLLFKFVSLSVAVILFEGGMSLKKAEALNVGGTILRLVTVAMMISFIGTGIAVQLLFDLGWGVSFLLSSLVVVTGPTVIGPILRHIALKKDTSAALRWEGIIIDPIGAILAVLVFNFISSSSNDTPMLGLVFSLFKTLTVGVVLGASGAFLLNEAIKRFYVPKFLINNFTLGVILAFFTLSDFLASESGLVTITIMGFLFGNIKNTKRQDILEFKESLSVLLVSTLFILLAANVNIEDIMLVFNFKTLLLLLLVVFVIRPIGVFVSSIGSSFTLQDKLFISWIGPKGIVAAGISSLFGMRMLEQGIPGAEYITPLVFMLILGTVLLNATTANFVARKLGVFLEKPQGILIVGASHAARLIAYYLNSRDREVILIDSNNNNVRRAKRLGLEAYRMSLFSSALENSSRFSDIGYVMALTPNTGLNQTAVERFQKRYGEKASFTFRLIGMEEINDPETNPEEGLFSPTVDFLKLTNIARHYPYVRETPIKSQENLDGMLSIINAQKYTVPLFIKTKEGHLEIISANHKEYEIEEEGCSLVYFGQGIQVEKEEKIDLSGLF